MTTDNPLNCLLSEHLAKLLKDRSFSRRGYSFVKRRNGNILLVEFQVWKERSTRDEVVFTVNLGVLSRRLFWLSENRDPPKRPAIDHCHWRERLGFLLPERQDRWWSVTKANLGPLAIELTDALLRIGLPAIEGMATDEALRDSWMNGRSSGLSAFERLRYLSFLLLEIGPRSKLDEVVAELRAQSQGMPWERVAELHIARIMSMRAGA